jgi:hypothetical protein
MMTTLAKEQFRSCFRALFHRAFFVAGEAADPLVVNFEEPAQNGIAEAAGATLINTAQPLNTVLSYEYKT